VFHHGHVYLQLNSALQRLAIITLLLLQLLVLLSEVLSDLTIAESTASGVDALLSLLLIIPALFYCKFVSIDSTFCIIEENTDLQVRRRTIWTTSPF
jgi:hypothetical protein